MLFGISGLYTTHHHFDRIRLPKIYHFHSFDKPLWLDCQHKSSEPSGLISEMLLFKSWSQRSGSVAARLTHDIFLHTFLTEHSLDAFSLFSTAFNHILITLRVWTVKWNPSVQMAPAFTNYICPCRNTFS